MKKPKEVSKCPLSRDVVLPKDETFFWQPPSISFTGNLPDEWCSCVKGGMICKGDLLGPEEPYKEDNSNNNSRGVLNLVSRKKTGAANYSS